MKTSPLFKIELSPTRQGRSLSIFFIRKPTQLNVQTVVEDMIKDLGDPPQDENVEEPNGIEHYKEKYNLELMFLESCQDLASRMEELDDDPKQNQQIQFAGCTVGYIRTRILMGYEA